MRSREIQKNRLASPWIFGVVSAAAFLLLSVLPASASDCSFIKGLQKADRYRCGKLMVPEDHAKPGGRKIGIAYVVIPARASKPRPDPVIYFSGGPGGGSLASGFIGFMAGSPLNETRDIVLFDQRGIQYSSPLPDVGPGVYAAMAADTDIEGERKLIAKVLSEFKGKADEAGIDLGAYNSVQNARDAAALMKFLGYKSYNLYGVSYGTRLARLIQDLYPDRINSVILESPNLMTDDFLIDRMKSYSSAASKTFAACRKDSKCRKEHPDLEIEYERTIDEIRSAPVKVTFEKGAFYINSQDAVYFLRRQLYRLDALEAFPAFLKALRTKDEKVLREAVATELADVADGSFNTSMFLAVSAFESMSAQNTPAVIGRMYKDLPHFPDQLGFFTNLYIEGMNWHGKSLPEKEREFKLSGVPTMIFVNQYDPVTPPENGRLLEKKLRWSYLYVINSGGHGGGNFPCKMRMMTEFMDDRWGAPDASCLPLFRD